MHRPLVLALVVLAAAPRQVFAEDRASQQVSRGLKLLHMQGCTACHSLDGRNGVGPTLAGRLGAETRVVEAGTVRVRAFDPAYLERSLRAPDEAVAEGYPAGVMPAYHLDAEQLSAMASALAELRPAPPAQPWRSYAAGLGLLAAAATLAVLWRRRATRGR